MTNDVRDEVEGLKHDEEKNVNMKEEKMQKIKKTLKRKANDGKMKHPSWRVANSSEKKY